MNRNYNIKNRRITYNNVGLVDSIIFSNNAKIEYTYNLNGEKLKVVQQTLYYPFGGIIADLSKNTITQDRLYNGKELDRTNSIFWSDYGARQYDATRGQWTTPDPLAEKYYGWNMYGYCKNNPIKFIDPDGRIVIADKAAQTNIFLTLNATERKYIQFREGILDYSLLNECTSNSANIQALKTLAKSDINYSFKVSNEHFGVPFYDIGENNSNTSNFSYDVTHLPGADNDPSPDNNVYIFTASFLPQEKQVKNTAHEGYGHAYFYELSRTDKSINPSHVKDVVGYFEDNFEGTTYTMPIFGQANKALEEQIDKVEKEALRNYENN